MYSLARVLGTLVLLSALSPAASIISATSCTTRDRIGSSTVTGASSCRNDIFGGSATASTYYDIRLDANNLVLLSGASILAGGRDLGGSGDASANIRITIQVGTEGSLRNGIVIGSFSQDFLRNGAVGGSTISANPDYFAPGFSLGFNYPRAVQLGTPLTITITDTAIGGAGFSDEAAGGGPESGLYLSFFEADGMTPVAIADVPEPRWLLASGLLFGIIIVRILSLSKASV